MTQSMGMVDFFAMEAGDYLERLDALVSPAQKPDSQEFRRLARALRGSAIMAGQHSIASVASGLEGISRGLADARLTWDEELRQLSIRAVDDLKVLVRSLNEWGDAEETRAKSIVQKLTEVSGDQPPTPHDPMARDELDAETRAFIGREGALVGSALDRAARSLRANTSGLEALDVVVKAMQPMRGLASLRDLPPLPDLFEGIDRLIGEMAKHGEATPTQAEILTLGARAVSRAAGLIAQEGKANPEASEVAAFAKQLGDVLTHSDELQPISDFVSDDAHQPADNPAATSSLELLSHAEYLGQFAAELENAQSEAQRTLKVQAVQPTLKALTNLGSSTTAHFAQTARDAIERGAATKSPSVLAAQIRQAGIVLSGLAQDPDADDSSLTAVIEKLGTLAQPEESVQPTPVEPSPEEYGPVAALESFANPQTAVDSGSTAPEVEEEDHAPSDDSLPAASLLETAYRRRSELFATAPDGAASLRELLQPDTSDSPPVEPPEADTDRTLPLITDFVYDVHGARQRIRELRTEVQTAMSTTLDTDHLNELLDEVFALADIGQPDN